MEGGKVSEVPMRLRINLSLVPRGGLSAQEPTSLRLFDEVRSALKCPDVRLVEAAHERDLLLVAGPTESAERIIRELRALGDPTQIVAITASPGANPRILDAGADDSLTYPFEPEELRARVRAVMRRSRRAWTNRQEISADPSTLRIRVRDAEAQVSRKQFKLFVCLAEHRERWVHSDEIIASMSGTHHQPTSSLVRVQIHALRKSLPAERACIRSDRNKSYMLTLTGGSTERDAHTELTMK